MKRCVVIALLATLFCVANRAAAGPIIVVDEFGNGVGTLSQGFFSTDPGPGGSTGVLTYRLPFAGTQGGVGFSGEPGIAFGGDLVRFNGNGTLIFYSDTVSGDLFDTPADTAAPPTALYANMITVGPEISPPGIFEGGFVVYTPQPGQPGFDPSLPTYVFFSEGLAIPEPSTIALLGFAVAGLAGWRWRGRKRATA